MLTKVIHFTSETCEPVVQTTEKVKHVLNHDEFASIIECRIYDIEADEAQPLMMEFNINTVPTSVFIDEKGHVIRKIMGDVPEQDLMKFINFDLEKTKYF